MLPSLAKASTTSVGRVTGVDYTGFVVFFEEEDIYMRVSYSLNGAYIVIHSEYNYSVDDQTNDFVMMEGLESHFILDQSNTAYQDFHFLWVLEGQEWIGPIAATGDQILREDTDNMAFVAFAELDPTQ